MNRNLLYLFLLVLVSCGAEKNSSSIFFAGEIVNPTSNYIVLLKGDVVIDSAELDEDNRFAFTLDSISEGLYHFNHDPELQYVYLEKGDSLLVRLNTTDFDESLVFSGSGEALNNFLLEVFLAHEEEAPAVRSMYRLNPTDFERKIDSLKQLKFDVLEELKSESKFSEKELKIANASVNYNYNTYKEEYPFKHKKLTGENIFKDLPPNFYAYRKELTFNDKDLTYLRPYYNFMINHVGNLSFMSCSHACSIKNNVVRNQLHFNKHKLHIIDSLVEEKELKDNLFRYVAFDYLLKVHDSEEKNDEFISNFRELSENNRHMDEIDALYQGIKNIQPKKQIPNVEVTSTDGRVVTLQEIAAQNKKTVFYFWSATDRMHFESIKRRIAQLSAKKPKYSFVGINIKTDESNWKGILETSGLDQSKQYRSSDFEELTKSLIVYPLNKCIITDDKVIVDAFANVYTSF
ncbi:TlpA family protein disulfide reductase [Zobellia uliginosa]|uniref:TlpA family protein disulfide reductase n=1 Tax=Zobellia uliginosa TaxID=143224 RepID=UPI0026E22C30|nr:transaldolase [Zobellia uliginosa]MDO6517031.1 transaldolase [Zobellia uliginosa]